MDSTDDFVYDPDALDYDYDEEEIQEMRKHDFYSTNLNGFVYLKRGQEMEKHFIRRTQTSHENMDIDTPVKAQELSLVSGDGAGASNEEKGVSTLACKETDEEDSDCEPDLLQKRKKLGEAGPSPKRRKLDEADTTDAKPVVVMEANNDAGETDPDTSSNVEEQYATSMSTNEVTSTQDGEMPHLVAIRPRRLRNDPVIGSGEGRVYMKPNCYSTVIPGRERLI